MKKYTLGTCWGSPSMEESRAGQYVRVADAEALQRQLDTALADCLDLQAALVDALAQVDTLTKERDTLRTTLRFADLRINRLLGHTPTTHVLPRLFRGQA